jgi:hypothetical protein
MTHKLGVGSVMLVLMTALFGVGCAQGVNFSGQSVNGAAGVGTVASSVPACEINIPQYLLEGNVNSFEFQNSVGVTFGYNQNGADSGAGGSASIQVTTASMSLSMEALNPLNDSQLYADTVSANQTSTNLNATIDFSQFNVSPNYYASTPLATVSLNGLELGVQGIKSQSDTVSWVGRVVQMVNSNTVLLNGGYVTGIQVGDTFNIYDDQFFWQDNTNPCGAGNTYLGSQHFPSTPVAVATVVSADPSSNVAVATIVMTGETAVILGAEAIPLNLVAPASGQPARYLKKNVLIGSVAAQSFALPGGGSFDFGTAVNGQLRSAVSSNGYVITN